MSHCITAICRAFHVLMISQDGHERCSGTSNVFLYRKCSKLTSILSTYIRHYYYMGKGLIHVCTIGKQRRLEGITCTILSDDVMQKSRAERSSIATSRVILCKLSSFLK